jgi:hypothetical protein
MRFTELIPFIGNKASSISALPVPISCGRRSISPRGIRVLTVAATTLGTVMLYLSWHDPNPQWMGMKGEFEEVSGSSQYDRPYWEDVREYEKHLPQHNLSLPYPEGRTGRYLHFDLQSEGVGWGNVITEM